MQKGLRAILYLRNRSKVKEFSAFHSHSPVGETSRSRFPPPGFDVFPVGETSGLDVPVARGPVPRDRWALFCRSRSSEVLACLPSDLDPFGIRRSRTTVFYRVRARRGTGPRPTVKCRFFPWRGGLSPEIVGLRGCWRGEPARLRVWHARAQALR